MDPFKTQVRASWDRAAAAWNDSAPLIRSWLADVTELMLEQAQLFPGAHVLDLAAGAGDQTLDVARRVGAHGLVLATDISAPILQFALSNALAAGLHNVHCKVADLEDLQLVDQRFDAAICRLGLMFCTDVHRALMQVRSALRPGGRFCAVVFGEPKANLCVTFAMATAMRHAGLSIDASPPPGSLLSLGEPGLLKKMFEDAGFHEVKSLVVSADFCVPTTQDYVSFIRSAASPIQLALAALDAQAQQQAWADIADQLEVFQQSSVWRGPNELILCSGVAR